MRFKKWTAGLLALMLAVSLFTFAPAAQAETGYATPRLFASASPTSGAWSRNSDPKELREYLFEKLYDCPAAIDISAYGFPTTALSDLQQFIWYGMPESFHVNGIGASYNLSTGLLAELTLDYRYDANTYHQQYTALKAAAEKMTADLAGRSQVEKALLLHDRLALACTYREGTVLTSDYTPYGALVEKTAVCQGYALAYKYLLEMVGMESEFCSSLTLKHAWNIVTVNGNQYHVDVTWDDPVPKNEPLNIDGLVFHHNFLRSTAGIIATGHTATDFTTAPTDTTYDNYYWQSLQTAFQLAGDEVYYIDASAATINRFRDRTAILSIRKNWPTEGGYYAGCFSCLGSDGTNLLYSLTDTVYLLNPVTLETQVLYQPEMPAGRILNIYGFKLEDGTLYCTLCSSPNFSSNDTYTKVTAPYVPPETVKLKNAVLIMRHLIGAETAPLTMDQNADGVLTIADAVLLLQSLVA